MLFSYWTTADDTGGCCTIRPVVLYDRNIGQFFGFVVRQKDPRTTGVSVTCEALLPEQCPPVGLYCANKPRFEVFAAALREQLPLHR